MGEPCIYKLVEAAQHRLVLQQEVGHVTLQQALQPSFSTCKKPGSSFSFSESLLVCSREMCRFAPALPEPTHAFVLLVCRPSKVQTIHVCVVQVLGGLYSCLHKYSMCFPGQQVGASPASNNMPLVLRMHIGATEQVHVWWPRERNGRQEALAALYIVVVRSQSSVHVRCQLNKLFHIVSSQPKICDRQVSLVLWLGGSSCSNDYGGCEE
jgi:hypothetical protein